MRSIWFLAIALAACGGNVALGGNTGDSGPAETSSSSSSGGSSGSPGNDGGSDSGNPDSSLGDASQTDTGSPDSNPPGCPTGQMRCNGTCVDTSSDDNNCGGCGNICTGSCEFGNCIVTVASGQTGATALALDATNVYWTTIAANANDAVMTAPKAGGTAVTLASNQNTPWALAVDATGIYWTSGSQSAVSVMRAALDGSNPTTLVSGQDTENIVIDANNVYWTENTGTGIGSGTGSVFAVPKTGGTAVDVGSATGTALGLAVEGSSVYWADLPSSGGNILSTAIDGGTPNLVTSFSHLPNGMVVADAMNVYWANEDGTILKAPLGGGPAGTLATGLNQPHGLAVDASDLYVAVTGSNGTNGSVVRVPLSGGPPVTLSAGGSPWAIAVDAVSIYWTDSDLSSVRKLAK